MQNAKGKMQNAKCKNEAQTVGANHDSPYNPLRLALQSTSPTGEALHSAFCISRYALFSTINIFVEKVELFLHNVQIF